MNDAQDAESYRWPALSPAAWLEEALVFCKCGNLLEDQYSSKVKCGYMCLGRAA